MSEPEDIVARLRWYVTALREMVDEAVALREREAKWRELVELFREEASGIYGLAYAHGWRGGPPDRVEHAAKLRRELGVE